MAVQKPEDTSSTELTRECCFRACPCWGAISTERMQRPRFKAGFRSGPGPHVLLQNGFPCSSPCLLFLRNETFAKSFTCLRVHHTHRKLLRDLVYTYTLKLAALGYRQLHIAKNTVTSIAPRYSMHLNTDQGSHLKHEALQCFTLKICWDVSPGMPNPEFAMELHTLRF